MYQFPSNPLTPRWNKAPTIRLCRLPTTFVWLFILAIACGTVRAELFEVETRQDVMVPMRDGVRLATDVYLPGPKRSARCRQMADHPTAHAVRQAEPAKGDGHYFAVHGYAVVFQDTRGRFRSEGVWHMLTDDGRDGVDTCPWIAKQPWSDGKSRHDRFIVCRWDATRDRARAMPRSWRPRFRSTPCRTWAMPA